MNTEPTTPALAVADDALFGVWVPARERRPTEKDADDFGEVYWCGREYVRRETPETIQAWDWTQEHNLNGHWMKTGVTRPPSPNIADLAPKGACQTPQASSTPPPL